MLALTRRIGEKILIGQDIVVTLVRMKGKGAVIVGVQAPAGVKILRGELSPNDHGLGENPEPALHNTPQAVQ